MKYQFIILTVFLGTLLHAEGVSMQEVETFWVWIALFALGMIAVMILFVSSRQMVKIEKMHREMLEKQKEIEQSQSLFLANMSENIYEIVERTYKGGHKPSEILNPAEEGKGKQLLDVTNDLIEFLRLKSKKVEIIHEKFNLNNVLNEVSGSVCAQFKGSSVELIFNIDNAIPRYLIGDGLNLEKTLRNLLEYVLSEVESGEVTLEIMMFGTFEEKVELQFRLTDTGNGLDDEAIEKLFTPVYDENSKEYTGLGLFVAKELIGMMHGELVVHSMVGKGTTFTMTLPFELLDPSNRRNYRLPEKVLTAKKVFIVDRNYNSALAIKKMFAYFRHDVKVVSKEEFLKRMHNLGGYDIVLLDESLFKPRTVEYLTRLKEEKKELKVIALNSLLEKDESVKADKVVDRVLTKPVNQERVFELIVNLYTLDRLKPSVQDESVTEESSLTHRGEITETANVTQESFRDFSGKRLLIVEDDVINQKVLSNILKVSGMEITIANNGREAVNTIKESDDGFDLVLMDINMPVMDGYVATQMIRLESRFDALPIVAFTALALDSEREKIFNSGMNAYLTKPLNIGKLYTVFQMYMPVSRKSNAPKASGDTHSNNILDVEKGISYANGNEGFYMEILNEFLDAYGQSADLFAKLVREHRYEQVKMLCLDMKGLTGTIGAKEMYGLISKIHQKVLYHQEEMLVDYIDAYAKELKRLNDEIRRYLAH
ncbi:MAG: response regulator [Sulfurovum sp.]|nr:response regulator [Sulfurovum sp.]